jgi:hypothetical protein
MISLIKTSFKIAVRVGFVTGLVKHIAKKGKIETENLL